MIIQGKMSALKRQKEEWVGISNGEAKGAAQQLWGKSALGGGSKALEQEPAWPTMSDTQLVFSLRKSSLDSQGSAQGKIALKQG